MKPMLPEVALQQHIAVLGKNGSGKTYAAKAVIVEPLLAAGKHVAIIDPTSAWWGLRSSADGKVGGFRVIVLGGDHGDLPLPALGGAAVARLVVEQRVNVIADTGNLTVGERTRWMIDFAGTLYRLNRVPLHLVIDEVHVFAPQGKVPDPDTGKMLHAVNQLASGGRSRGIRLTMITQRPQKLHKDALTTADTLIAMRVLAPHDREAVKAWIDGCGDPVQGRDVLNSLAQLARGEGWVWYPEGHHLVRTKFPPIKTFDSSATPTEGRALSVPKGVAEVDLTEVRAVLADAVKEAEANDPKLLRAAIAKLQGEFAKRPTEKVLAVDHDAVRAAETRGYAAGCNDMCGQYKELPQVNANIQGGVDAIRFAIDKIDTMLGRPLPTMKAAPAVSPSRTAARVDRPVFTPPQNRRAVTAGAATSSIDKPMPRAILTALAQHREGLTKGQILVHTGYRSSGPVSACFAELARNGWMVPDRGGVAITEQGLQALGAYEPLPTGADLRQHLLNGGKCSTMEKAMLKVLFEAYPESIAKGAILEATGYASSGPVSAAFARLVALGYARKAGHGTLTAAQELFA